ncbi:hypothetical protein DERP_006622 [Dermatophagoides pteronyssinus]|uniref:Uncharacterized protein n=1 Tax=Dermatophagoides pteronyssinus TaxID=6956 RepID=A0ABQ8IQR4_DERPT|nr:hypothetical protein DERP_006622 [Dermatophagoides pteronyssinus]
MITFYHTKLSIYRKITKNNVELKINSADNSANDSMSCSSIKLIKVTKLSIFIQNPIKIAAKITNDI